MALSNDDSSSSTDESNLSDEEEDIIINYLELTDQEAQEDASQVDPSYDLKDETKRIIKEIHIAIDTVKESEFYSKLVHQVEGDAFQEQLKSFLGSNSSLNMVIYALGDLEFFYNTRYQLAIALLLKEKCSWIEDIEVYDPDFLRSDIIVLRELGCHVLSINEKAKRIVERPTLFFIPYYRPLRGNLLEANWCPSQINQLLLLTNRFKYDPFSDPLDNEYEEAIKKYIIEIPTENLGGGLDGLFHRFAWNFFKVDSQLDLDDSLSDTYTRWEKMFRISKSKKIEMRQESYKIGFDSQGYTFKVRHSLAEKSFLKPYNENASEKDWDGNSKKKAKRKERMRHLFMEYRGPRKYRCSWRAPPKGWIKLNIASRKREGKISSGYGGICHNEHMEPLLVYCGSVERVDEFDACVKTLKLGLVDILQKFKTRKIIIEGDSLKVIQWANRWHPPPYQVDQSLQEIHDLLEQFDLYVVYHVYEEANAKAISLAEHGNRECL